MRIVTLLPSATEIVCALGLVDKLVGVSHACNRPAAVRKLPKMTSTRIPRNADSKTIDASVRKHLEDDTAPYDLDLEALRDANPDVIVSQALCDVCAVSTVDVDEAVCSLPGPPALIDLTPNTLDDVFDDIERVAAALNARRTGNSLVDRLRTRRDRVAAETATIPSGQRPLVAFLEWLIPPFNGGHWNPELVCLAGGTDVLGARGRASRTLQWQEIVDARPDVVFVACCGYTTERAMQDVDVVRDTEAWQSLPAVQNDRVYVADGNAFSSPGPRLLDGLELLARKLHPRVHPRRRNDAW